MIRAVIDNGFPERINERNNFDERRPAVTAQQAALCEQKHQECNARVSTAFGIIQTGPISLFVFFLILTHFTHITHITSHHDAPHCCIHLSCAAATCPSATAAAVQLSAPAAAAR
jgi:hypothetical protein